jgi:transcriptional regulator with XRE-family HTH domain
MKDNKKNLAEMISEARELKGISMRELARLSGMDHAEISRIEKGKRLKPNILFLRRIAENLDLSLVELLRSAGYSELDISWGMNAEKNKSSQDLKKELDQSKRDYLDLLRSHAKNKDIAYTQMHKIDSLTRAIEEDKIVKEYIIKELNNVREQLYIAAQKYKKESD